MAPSRPWPRTCGAASRRCWALGEMSPRLLKTSGCWRSRRCNSPKWRWESNYASLSRALIWGMMAATFGFLMLPFLFLAVMFALALVLPLWAAALATTGLLAILAIGAGFIAYRQFRQVRLIPKRTVESVKEDVKWARSQWNSN